MEIEKAIERLETFVQRHTSVGHSELIPSIKLGIEALRTVHKMRHYPFPDGIFQLPGETKD